MKKLTRTVMYDQAWWGTLVQWSTRCLSHACPRAQCSGWAYYEYITAQEGQSMILRCGCGACDHIVVRSGSGTPFIPSAGGPVKDTDVRRLEHLLTSMGVTQDRPVPARRSKNRRLLVPGEPGRRGRSLTIESSDFEEHGGSECKNGL